MNFDEFVDRNQYPAMKWSPSFLEEHFGNASVVPMSVADMDFKTPGPIVEQLQKRVEHGIFGYEYKPDAYFDALESWYQSRYEWSLSRQHLEFCSSVLNAVAILINQHSAPGQGVIIQSPVFFEFRMVIRSNERKIVKNPLRLVEGRYEIDFADLEAKAADPNNKILILCNPHNPVGRVWQKTELEQVGAICARHNVFVIADEIHGDFALPPHHYQPYMSLPNEMTHSAAACISPAKTFNISGMIDAMTIIPNDTHRHQFSNFTHRYQINKTNVFASVAIETAYREGADWLDALRRYIQANVDFTRNFLLEHVPDVSLIEPEGTFLLWIDFRKLGLDAKALEKFLAQEAQIAVAPGYWFGREGAGFARMTIACPRETLHRAMERLAKAVKRL